MTYTHSSPYIIVPLSPPVHTNGLYEVPMQLLQSSGSSTTGECRRDLFTPCTAKANIWEPHFETLGRVRGQVHPNRDLLRVHNGRAPKEMWVAANVNVVRSCTRRVAQY